MTWFKIVEGRCSVVTGVKDVLAYLWKKQRRRSHLTSSEKAYRGIIARSICAFMGGMCMVRLSSP